MGTVLTNCPGQGTVEEVEPMDPGRPQERTHNFSSSGTCYHTVSLRQVFNKPLLREQEMLLQTEG